MSDAFLDIRLRDLRFFERLAALGTLTAVARELHVPKATASRWLAELEERVGAPLARRTTRALSLTPAGEQLAERARAMLSLADEARLSLGAEAPTGVIRISVPVPLGRLAAGAFIARVRRQLPRVRVEILLQNQKVDLVREGIDLAIRGGDLQDSELVARRLANVSLWLYASAELAAADPATLPLVAFPGDEAVLRRAGYAVAPAVAVVDDRTAVADALAWGAGMGVLPTFLGEPGCARGALARLGDAPVAVQPIHALYHASQRDDVRLRVVIDEIQHQLRETL